MPLNKVVKGNMYDFCTHTHTHLGGECKHKCVYCYVHKGRYGIIPRYTGEPRLVEKELLVKYGRGNTIFIEHMNDICHPGIKNEWIIDIFNHMLKYPHNKYVIQTKNPGRLFQIISSNIIPKEIFEKLELIIGTTIESNRSYGTTESIVPTPIMRFLGFQSLTQSIRSKSFVTIEPIMDFDIDVMIDWLKRLCPDFVNIGADSKGCNLMEPSREKVNQFIELLRKNKIVLREKSNLERLLK